MAPFPPIRFFLADKRAPVSPGSRCWNASMPMDRRSSGVRPPTRPPEPIRYGDYFAAAADFLQHLGRPALSSAAAKILGRPVSPESISTILVFLEKHGALYHPARIRVEFDRGAVSLVLNVALSPAGKRQLEAEPALLRSLRAVSGRWLPAVFFVGAGRTASGRRLPMFLAEWFDGFCEFHLAGGGDATVIWDPQTGARAASAAQRRELYRGVARIWGEYYRLETGARIHPWHHAAGDFVVRANDDGVDLRLITVRGYPASIRRPDAGPERVFRELLVAFLDLSMRTRIDRTDGTGDLIWADGSVVEPTLVGAVEALTDKAPAGAADPAGAALVQLLADLPEAALVGLAREAAEGGFFPGSPELDLITRRLPAHAGRVAAAARHLAGRRLPADGTTR